MQSSFKVAALDGTIVVAIHYKDRLLARRANGTDFAKRELTVAVACCVRTDASLSAILKGS